MEEWRLKSWALPLIVVALLVPSVAGFAIGGPGLGMALGAASVAALIYLAGRAGRRGPIDVATGEDRDPLLVVALEPIEDPAMVGEITSLLGDRDPGAEGEPEVIVLAPARGRRIRRWLSDSDPARYDAQRNLALSVATLSAAGLHAEGRVGDADPVQAVEDLVYQQPVRALAFAVSGAELDEEISDLRGRIDRPVCRIGEG
ncbi:MAG: hypothetical protein ACR2K6_04765 [Solirubrobacterales bacterium]